MDPLYTKFGWKIVTLHVACPCKIYSQSLQFFLLCWGHLQRQIFMGAPPFSKRFMSEIVTCINFHQNLFFHHFERKLLGFRVLWKRGYQTGIESKNEALFVCIGGRGLNKVPISIFRVSRLTCFLCILSFLVSKVFNEMGPSSFLTAKSDREVTV